MNLNEQVIKVATEMLESRGFNVTPDNDNIFIATSNESPDIHLYLLNTPLNKATIVHYIQVFITKGIEHAILIYRDSITSSVKKTLKNVVNCRVELFSEAELKFNITKHVLVPHHEQVDPHDHPKRDKYPTILKTDPVVRFYGFRVGNVIRITRPNHKIYYRVVR
jgi:DNA-directed RNA polymerase I, II, and III subunit RPABC1